MRAPDTTNAKFPQTRIVFIGKTAGMKKYTVSPRNFESRDEAEISGGSLYRCR